MSLAILDGNGVIDRLLSIDAAPLPADRTTLKLFEIPGLACANISQVLCTRSRAASRRTRTRPTVSRWSP